MRLVAGLIESNGDEYADVLELGATDDDLGERNLTGAALVARVHARVVFTAAGAKITGMQD